jgi:hypothetical protein
MLQPSHSGLFACDILVTRVQSPLALGLAMFQFSDAVIAGLEHSREAGDLSFSLQTGPEQILQLGNALVPLAQDLSDLVQLRAQRFELHDLCVYRLLMPDLLSGDLLLGQLQVSLEIDDCALDVRTLGNSLQEFGS